MTKAVAAAIYARISSDQDGSGLGVARQVKECRDLAESRGWTVVDEFVDNDISAYSGKTRPQYERMLTAMREGHVTGVVVYHLDRLTRQPRELEAFVDLCDQIRLTKLATVAGDVNIGTGDGLLIARIQAAVAANESASKSRRMRSKWQQKAETGEPQVWQHALLVPAWRSTTLRLSQRARSRRLRPTDCGRTTGRGADR